MAPPPTIAQYSQFVRQVSRRFLEVCPNTHAATYRLRVAPEGLRCPPRDACFLITARESNWVPEVVGFEMEGRSDDPARDLPSVARILARGDYGLLRHRRNLFAFFFESFVRLYSKHCRFYVEEPVARQVEAFEHRLDDFATTTLRRRLGPMVRVYVDRGYVPHFERLYGSYKVWGINRTMRDVAAGRDVSVLSQGAARGSAGFFMSNYRKLERLIDDRCTDPVVRSAYANMLRFAHRTTPLPNPIKMPQRP